MKKSRFTDSQILAILKQSEAGAPVTDLCREYGMVERLIRSVKERCLWLHNVASLDKARQALGAWFKYYNVQHPDQALSMTTPSETYKIAA